MAKHKDHTHSTVDHHEDGSHTLHRHHKDGSKHSSAHADLDSLHDAIQDHLGEANPGEAEADAGQHGVPADHAASAGLPTPGGVPPAGV
jgi:hypothetical protein